MTATQTQIRRDTAANLASVTPATSELAHDTTNNRVNIGDGSRLAGWQMPNFRDIQRNNFNYAPAGGTGNAIIITLTPPLLAYGQGEVNFLAVNNNTGATAAYINSLGARTVVKLDTSTLSLVGLDADDIVAGCPYKLIDTGSQYVLAPMGVASSVGGGWNLLAVNSGGGATYDIESVIDSTYKGYAILLQNILPATDSAALRMRVKRSGQASYDAGASDYTWTTSKAGSSGVTGSSDDADAEIVLMGSVSNSGSGVSGLIICNGLGQALRAMFNWNLSEVASGNSTVGSSTGGGLRVSTDAIEGVRFLFSSGNISSGKSYIYGIASAL